MKIKEIKLNALINMGPYSHVTMDVIGEVSEGEDILAILENFKARVQKIMDGASLEEIKEIPVAVGEVKEEKPKQTRTRKSKEEVKVEEGPVETPEEYAKKTPPNKSKITPYGADNKAVLQAYLTSKYAESWKTSKPRNEIIDFTSKLPGMEFLDEEGNIVPSFLEHIHGFFGPINA